MEFLSQTFTEMQVYGWEAYAGYWMFIGTMGLLLIEVLRLIIKNSMTWTVFGDGIANFITYSLGFDLLRGVGVDVHNDLLWGLVLFQLFHNTNEHLDSCNMYRSCGFSLLLRAPIHP